MPASASFIKAVAKQVTKLMEDYQWIPVTAANQTTSWVINHQARKVKASIKGHLYHNIKTTHDGKKTGDHVGDVYHCADGYEYFNIGDKLYRHDPVSDKFYDATP